MSRYKNILTGERYMTEQNTLRHYISKAYKAKKSRITRKMRKLWSDSTKVIDVDWCFKYIQDDFGYCGLRGGKVSDEEQFMKYCFEGWIKNMERDLAELQRGGVIVLRKISKVLRAYVRAYKEPPYGREIEGTVELLEEAANNLEKYETFFAEKLKDMLMDYFDIKMTHTLTILQGQRKLFLLV